MRNPNLEAFATVCIPGFVPFNNVQQLGCYSCWMLLVTFSCTWSNIVSHCLAEKADLQSENPLHIGSNQNKTTLSVPGTACSPEKSVATHPPPGIPILAVGPPIFVQKVSASTSPSRLKWEVPSAPATSIPSPPWIAPSYLHVPNVPARLAASFLS